MATRPQPKSKSPRAAAPSSSADAPRKRPAARTPKTTPSSAAPSGLRPPRQSPAKPRAPRAAKPSGPTAAAPEVAAVAAGSPGVVAVTGAFGFYGRRLLALLEADETVERIVAVDVKGPDERRGGKDAAAFLTRHARVSAHQLDLTDMGAEDELAAILRSEGCGSLVHLAYLADPSHALEMAHELETMGTLYVLGAARKAGVAHVVNLSQAMCYGARRDNPAWLTEDQPLRPPQSRSLKDKASAEAAVARFGLDHKDVVVATARLGAVLGGGSDHFWTRIFARPVMPSVLGYDPLLQLLEPDDAVQGLYALWKSRARGTFNLVGRGVLPLSRIARRLGHLRVPVPAGLGKSLASTLWSAQLIDMPPAFLDFLRWSFVCDGARLQDATGFVPQHDILTVLNMFSAELRGKRAPDRDDSGPDDAAEAS